MKKMHKILVVIMSLVMVTVILSFYRSTRSMTPGVILSFVMVTVILRACTNGSTGNTGNNTTQKPTESVTQEPNPEVTQTPDSTATPDSTEAPSATAEPQTSEGTIIPLFPEASSDQIHQLSPEEIPQASNFIPLFNPYDTGKIFGTVEDGGGGSALYTTEYMNRSFELGYQQPNGTTITVTLWYIGPIIGVGSEENHNFCNMYYEFEGGESGMVTNFIPLYYNQAKQCLVGYRPKAANWFLCEIYYDGTFFNSQPVEDLSIYGF